MAPRRQKTAVEHPAWLEQARQIADFGDRWLVSLGRGVSRLGRWAEAEAAAPTRPDPPSAPKPRRRTSPSSSQRERRKPKPESSHTRSERSSLGLLSATPAQPAAPAAPEPFAACAEGAEHAPGVLPLVQALGRVVADHRDASYTSLAADERLWTLVELLQVLSQRPRSDPSACGPSEGPQAPPTREP
jgi:hypothetical protein